MFDNITTVPAKMKPYFSEDACDILKWLLQIDPENRLSDPDTAKSHPFFINIDWKAMENREIKPPMKPKLRETLDLRYFNTSFLDETPKDSVANTMLSVRAKARNHYEGFTYQDNMHV